MTSESRVAKFEKGDIALFVAPVTAFSYGMAYIYKLGQFHYYGIPSIFIELNLRSLTGSILTILPLVIITAFMYYVFFIKLKSDQANNREREDENKKNTIIKLISLTFSLFVLICMLYLTFKYLGNLIILLILISLFTPIISIFIYLFYKKENILMYY